MRWAKWEIDYLILHANDGARAIAAKLGRSLHAVEVQACRFGVSLRRSWTCPRCGLVTFSPLSVRTGWCRTCSVQISHQVAEERNEEIRKEVKNEQARYEAAKRARQAVYSDNYRAEKKLRRIRELREVNEKYQ